MNYSDLCVSKFISSVKPPYSAAWPHPPSSSVAFTLRIRSHQKRSSWNSHHLPSNWCPSARPFSLPSFSLWNGLPGAIDSQVVLKGTNLHSTAYSLLIVMDSPSHSRISVFFFIFLNFFNMLYFLLLKAIPFSGTCTITFYHHRHSSLIAVYSFFLSPWAHCPNHIEISIVLDDLFFSF